MGNTMVTKVPYGFSALIVKNSTTLNAPLTNEFPEHYVCKLFVISFKLKLNYTCILEVCLA